MRRYLALSFSPRPRRVRHRAAPGSRHAATPRSAAAIEQNSLVGLTAQELVASSARPRCKFGKAAASKLQFRDPRCVLDAYLYPSGNAGTLKVTHVDTRLPSGADMPQAACTTALHEAAS